MSTVVTAIEKEFVFNQIIKTQGKVLVFGPGKHVYGKLKSIDKEFLVIDAFSAQAELFVSWEHVSVYCNYLGQRMTFPAKIRKVEGSRIFMQLPETVLKTPQRKSVRVPPPQNVTLEFFMSNQHVAIDYPESCEYIDVEMPALSEDLDSSSIQTLMDSFKQKAGMFAGVNGVIMFAKPRMPETIEEKLIANFGRSLLIPSTRTSLPAEDPYPEGRIITQSMADTYEGPSIFIDGSNLEKSRLAKSGSGITSELYCPIQFYQFVIGYVYMRNDDSHRMCMDYKSLDFAWEFSRILAYKLQEHNYFKLSEKKPDPYKPVVLDLSPGGCLIGLPKAKFAIQLKPNTGLRILLRSHGETQEIKAKIARKFADPTTTFYGLAFMGVNDELMSTLKQMLYADSKNDVECDELSYSLDPTANKKEEGPPIFL